MFFKVGDLVVAFNFNRNPLRVAVERQTEVKLYPEDDEPVNILNVKRGIVSALMVPEMTEENNQNVVNLFSRFRFMGID